VQLPGERSKEAQKRLSHAKILASAAQLLRERGIAGASIADVMKGAGLTVGGFYAHFASKDALIDATLERAAAAIRERLFAQVDDAPTAERGEIVLTRYLSAAHRDAVTEGCPLPAIVGDVATTAHVHRETLRDQIDLFVSELEGHLPHGGKLSRRVLAVALVALMYGGLTLARSVRGTALSDEILAACRALGRFATLATRPNRTPQD